MTARDVEVLDALAEGLQNREIADRLGITTSYVKQRLTRIYRILGVESRLEAALAWVKQ